MPVFVAGEVVTAAKQNLIYKPVTSVASSNRTFTNTGFFGSGCFDWWGWHVDSCDRDGDDGDYCYGVYQC